MGKLSDFDFQNQDANQENVNEQDIRAQYDTYTNMAQTQPNRELLSEVARQKAQGKFDYQKLSSMVDSLQGMLSQQDFNNIKRILESLK